MNKKHIFLSATMSGLLLLSACGNTENVATSKIGNIAQKDFNKELKNKYGKEVLSSMMIEQLLLNKYKVSNDEAQKKVDEYKKQMGENFKSSLSQMGFKNEDEFKEKIMPQIALEKAIKASITEKELKEYYKPTLKVSHILIKDEKKVKEIKDKLNNGGDFAALAKEHSEDPGSKEQGGDLGELDAVQMEPMDPKFKEATYKLEVGQISEPVKSSFGYHIIKVTDKKELKPFDQEKDNIQKELETMRAKNTQWRQKFIKDLIKKENVQVTDNDLKDTFKELENKSN
ncbi:peptidylprolyl isomerase [Bacillus cereus]|uniref:peptidylprolyl isomerase n=1 Tax=Bacillus thuringiensis TaxID=1428 RepID=UPI00044B7944|nr:peptidylprolyl isomerase [Bacillus thuringiensis]MEB8637037.1 peptidylprolyl isomerase [Bacillus cereus]EXY06088.1 peptidylprolyl isomerase [Bacillus thuringiensis]MEB8743411.1 peptidylprolyl isomerase [Bacillus cereus]MEB8798711.1 peptidylprolyl isomerase [Bacillus cereus]MEB8810856.1 peptidylprolyl isomerase [Bacillus cereus]